MSRGATTQTCCGQCNKPILLIFYRYNTSSLALRRHWSKEDIITWSWINTAATPRLAHFRPLTKPPYADTWYGLADRRRCCFFWARWPESPAPRTFDWYADATYRTSFWVKLLMMLRRDSRCSRRQLLLSAATRWYDVIPCLISAKLPHSPRAILRRLPLTPYADGGWLVECAFRLIFDVWRIRYARMRALRFRRGISADYAAMSPSRGSLRYFRYWRCRQARQLAFPARGRRITTAAALRLMMLRMMIDMRIILRIFNSFPLIAPAAMATHYYW